MQVLSLLSGFILWEIIGRVTPVVVPPPTKVAGAWVSLVVSGKLLGAVLISLRSLAIGFPIALAAGIVLGLLIGRFRKVGYLVDIYINALMSTPTIALIPLLMIWFGMGFTSRVAVVFLFSFFVIVINTTAGVRGVPEGLVEMGRSFGGTERQVFSRIVLPASLPAIMTGLRLGAGRAVKGMVTAEMILVLSGMGAMVASYGSAFAMDYVFAIVLTIVAIAVLLMNVVYWLDGRLTHWRKTEQSLE